MEFKDYKNAMSSLHIAQSTKRRIVTNCCNGVQPREIVGTRKTSARVRKIVAFAASFALIVTAALGLFMLMRLIGPETPVDPNGDSASSITQAKGFRLVSIESTLEGLTARIDSYDAETKSINMAWVNNSGKDLGLGRAYSLYKMDGEEWVTTPFEKQVFWEEDFREYPSGTECSNYGVIGSLTRWSDNITAGRYKVEKEFYGDGNKHTVTIIFELTEMQTEAPTEMNGFTFISCSTHTMYQGVYPTFKYFYDGILELYWTNETQVRYEEITGTEHLYRKNTDGTYVELLPNVTYLPMYTGIPFGEKTYVGKYDLSNYYEGGILPSGEYKLVIPLSLGDAEVYQYAEILFSFESGVDFDDPAVTDGPEVTDTVIAEHFMTDFNYTTTNEGFVISRAQLIDSVLYLQCVSTNEYYFTYDGNLAFYFDGREVYGRTPSDTPEITRISPHGDAAYVNVSFTEAMGTAIESGEYKITFTIKDHNEQNVHVEVFVTLLVGPGYHIGEESTATTSRPADVTIPIN